MKLGAFDYITKPLKDDIVKLTIDRACPTRSSRKKTSR